MTYDHCPKCGSYDFSEVGKTSHNSTVYECEDCGYEFEIDDDMFGYDTLGGWYCTVDDE